MDGRDGSGPLFSGLQLWYIVPVVFVVAVLAVGAFAVSQLNRTEAPDEASAAEIAKLPPYWIVKDGQTYAQIAERTGLSIDQLETFNPRINPATLLPGERIKLREHVPPPPPKPLGPKFWKVRTGQSFGSIAAATGKPIDTLMALNKRLKPEELRPGDRVRLRR
jgi:LysM repeat protein